MPRDARAFEERVRTWIEPLRRYLHRRADADTADDVLGDVLLVCWRRAEELPAPPGPDEVDEGLLWAYGVARGCLQNASRAERRRGRLTARVAAVDPPDPVAPSPAPSDPRVLAALSLLRADEAELLRLWAWEGLGPTEIATVLGLTPNAVSLRLHRARGHLRELLGSGETPGPGPPGRPG